MGDLAIQVRGLGKQYRLGGSRERYSTVRDQVRRLMSAPLRALYRRAKRAEHAPSFWALQSVSFDVRQGEVIGIIGRNGAGKSTLLKVLSRITEPTEGEVDIYGRVGSLLEVGTGFHPELTGRENIYLNGAILGMRRAEIARKFDEIVAFAEVERFIDTPVKHYSSGMYLRLGFAVAAHLEPEILIVDEVLAVGDAEFQKKCLGKMTEVARAGRTVLFVSHNMHAVASLCSRGIVLRQGEVGFDGPAPEAISRYLSEARVAAATERADRRAGSGEWRFTRAVPAKPLFDSREPKAFDVRVEAARGGGSAYLSGQLLDEQARVIAQFDSRLVGVWLSGDAPFDGRLVVNALWLKPGCYSVDLFVCTPGGFVDKFDHACEFEVSPVLPYPHSASEDAIASGAVLTDFAWVPGAGGPAP